MDPAKQVHAEIKKSLFCDHDVTKGYAKSLVTELAAKMKCS